MRWQKKRWSSNSTLRSTDNSGILQCFRGTTVCAASGGLDMHVPDPFLETKPQLYYITLWERGTGTTGVGQGHRDSQAATGTSQLPLCVSSRRMSELTSSEIAPRWPGSWWSGSRCWPSPVHCSAEVCSTWYGSPLSFHQPSQTHPRLTSPSDTLFLFFICTISLLVLVSVHAEAGHWARGGRSRMSNSGITWIDQRVEVL